MCICGQRAGRWQSGCNEASWGSDGGERHVRAQQHHPFHYQCVAHYIWTIHEKKPERKCLVFDEMQSVEKVIRAYDFFGRPLIFPSKIIQIEFFLLSLDRNTDEQRAIINKLDTWLATWDDMNIMVAKVGVPCVGRRVHACFDNSHDRQCVIISLNKN